MKFHTSTLYRRPAAAVRRSIRIVWFHLLLASAKWVIENFFFARPLFIRRSISNTRYAAFERRPYATRRRVGRRSRVPSKRNVTVEQRSGLGISTLFLITDVTRDLQLTSHVTGLCSLLNNARDWVTASLHAAGYCAAVKGVLLPPRCIVSGSLRFCSSTSCIFFTLAPRVSCCPLAE